MAISTSITIDPCEIRFMDPYLFAHVMIKIGHQDGGLWATIDMTLPIEPAKASLPAATLRAEIEQFARSILATDEILRSIPAAPAGGPPYAP